MHPSYVPTFDSLLITFGYRYLNLKYKNENIESSDHQKSNASGASFSCSLHVGDIWEIDKFVKPRNFTLAVGDIPYGLNAPGSEFDNKSFNEKNILEMVTNFSKVTTSNLWRFVAIHSLQHANMPGDECAGEGL